MAEEIWLWTKIIGSISAMLGIVVLSVKSGRAWENLLGQVKGIRTLCATLVEDINTGNDKLEKLSERVELNTPVIFKTVERVDRLEKYNKRRKTDAKPRS